MYLKHLQILTTHKNQPNNKSEQMRYIISLNDQVQ